MGDYINDRHLSISDKIASENDTRVTLKNSLKGFIFIL